ncbi:MAG: iron-sulfur cluster assembly accessory protein [Candidatus Omnitrophica bacterium CG11_big_fil_rev_8_21_14_0_20_64_10]|nr:MAG: iron-sulfur cluster assembly accessory protein [Candidatus Omnitrophica bacterium CG11_big_fil_rev_8_21_14_0_20_64_10]
MITLTEKAVQKVTTLQKEQNKPGHGLRLKVVGGGCSGYSYSMDFEPKEAPGDQVFETAGVKLFVDPKSLPMVDNCQVDWADGMTGAGFTIQNPNAKGSCGCGHSFSV